MFYIKNNSDLNRSTLNHPMPYGCTISQNRNEGEYTNPAPTFFSGGTLDRANSISTADMSFISELNQQVIKEGRINSSLKQDVDPILYIMCLASSVFIVAYLLYIAYESVKPSEEQLQSCSRKSPF